MVPSAKFHSIIHSTVPVHIPVQQLETPSIIHDISLLFLTIDMNDVLNDVLMMYLDLFTYTCSYYHKHLHS